MSIRTHVTAHPFRRQPRARNHAALAALLASACLVPSLASAEPLIGLLDEDEPRIVKFDSATPTVLTATIEVTGMAEDAELLAIDFRSQTGELFGLGNDSRVYKIDERTGAASAVFPAQLNPVLDLDADGFGFDCDPQSDDIRISSASRQNLRFDVRTGTVTAGTPFSYADPATSAFRDSAEIALVGLSYQANTEAGQAVLFGIDANFNELVVVSGDSGNLFQLTPVPAPGTREGNTLGIEPDDRIGFDVSATSGAAYVVAQNGPANQALYTLDLVAGRLTTVGDTREELRDLTAGGTPGTSTGSSSSGGSNGGGASSSGGAPSGSSGVTAEDSSVIGGGSRCAATPGTGGWSFGALGLGAALVLARLGRKRR